MTSSGSRASLTISYFALNYLLKTFFSFLKQSLLIILTIHMSYSNNWRTHSLVHESLKVIKTYMTSFILKFLGNFFVFAFVLSLLCISILYCSFIFLKRSSNAFNSFSFFSSLLSSYTLALAFAYISLIMIWISCILKISWYF